MESFIGIGKPSMNLRYKKWLQLKVKYLGKLYTKHVPIFTNIYDFYEKKQQYIY